MIKYDIDNSISFMIDYGFRYKSQSTQLLDENELDFATYMLHFTTGKAHHDNNCYAQKIAITIVIFLDFIIN